MVDFVHILCLVSLDRPLIIKNFYRILDLYARSLTKEKLKSQIHILNDENSLLLRNQNNFAKQHLQQGVTLGFPPITKEITESVINNNLIIFSDLTQFNFFDINLYES